MAKIPRYQENQRLNPPGPSQAYDTGSARMEGENIEATGRQLQGFANQIETYKKVKEKTDEAIFAKEFLDKSTKKGQNREAEIRTNRDENGEELGVAIDGSNVESLYDNSFAELYAEADAIPDGRRRRIARNAIAQGQNVYRAQILEHKITIHNAAVFLSSDNSIKEMSARISDDPSLFEQELEKEMSFQSSLPLGGENTIKQLKRVRESAALAVIQGHQKRGDFKSAEEAIKGPLSKIFTPEDGMALLQKNKEEERSTRTNQWAIEAKARKDREEKREDDRSDLFYNVLTNINSPDPIKRQEAIDIAKGSVGSLINQSEFDDLKKTDVNYTYENSKVASLPFIARSERYENMSSYIDDVLKNKELSPEDKAHLINRYSEVKGRKKADPFETYERTRAGALLDKLYEQTAIDKKLGAADMAVYRLKIDKLFIDKMKGAVNGVKVRPVEAAIQAINELDPNNLYSDTINSKENISVQKLNTEEAEIKERIRRKKERQGGQLTEKDVDKFTKSLQKIKIQREALKNKSSIEKAVKGKNGK